MLIAYVALLIGCTGGGGSSLKVDDDYRTGTGTVQLTFDPTTTTKMYEGETGVVVIRAKNAGAHTIETGRIVLSSDDSTLYFGDKAQYESNAAQTNTKSLVKSANRPFFGKSAISPSGDQLAYDFSVYALNLPQESQQRSAKVVAIACFPYQTFQSANVCIDSDPYNLKTTKDIKTVCDAKDTTMRSGGGPVNVDTVQVRFASDAEFDVSPTFYFSLSASSSGMSGLKFFAPGAEQSFCDSRIISTPDDNNLVYFRATLSDRLLICTGGDEVAGYRNVYAVKLYDQKARVTCKTDGPLNVNDDVVGNYYAPLTVNISYGVVTSQTQTILVNALRQS